MSGRVLECSEIAERENPAEFHDESLQWGKKILSRKILALNLFQFDFTADV